MSHPVARRLGGLGLGTLAVLCALPALAADFAYPPYPEPAPGRVYREERIEEELPPPPPRRPVVYGPRFVAGPYGAPPPPEECRTIVKHRIDEDGEEVERRVRICDERLGPPGPRFRPSFYRPHPVPPAYVPEGPFDGPRRW